MNKIYNLQKLGTYHKFTVKLGKLLLEKEKAGVKSEYYDFKMHGLKYDKRFLTAREQRAPFKSIADQF